MNTWLEQTNVRLLMRKTYLVDPPLLSADDDPHFHPDDPSYPKLATRLEWNEHTQNENEIYITWYYR